MRKIFAVLTKKGHLSSQPLEADLNVFEMEEEQVVGYENIKINGGGYSQFLSLLKVKHINLLYMDSITDELKKLLDKTGITVRSKEESKEDKFLNTFIFS